MNPDQITTALNTARAVTNGNLNPISLAGRALGLSEAETRRPVPGWFWLVLGLGAGVAIGMKAEPVRRKLGL